MRRRWHDFWFETRPPQYLALVRVAYFATLFVLAVQRPVAAIASAHPASFWRPIWLVAQITPTPPTYAPLHLLELAWDVTLLTSALGLATRLSTIASASLTLYFLGLLNSFGTVSHGKTPVALATIVFALCACGDVWSVDALLRRKPAPIAAARYAWPLRLLHVIWCSMFFAAGVSKLTKSGLAWVFSDNLATMLLAAPHRYPDVAKAASGLGLCVAHHPALCVALAMATMALELGAPLALMRDSWARFIVAAMAVMQIGVYLTMFENFVWMLPLYLVWLPLVTTSRNILKRSCGWLVYRATRA